MAWTREQMAARAAKDLRDGYYVNLGIGIPTLVSNYIPEGIDVSLQSENGMLGMGPFPYEGEEDADLINAGKQTVSELPSTSYFNSAESFGMVRGGHIDLSILGEMAVAQNGDLATWMIPGKMVKGMGGAMDLVGGVKRVVVVMEHSAKDGQKLLKKCNLPLTGEKVVDLVVTDLAVFTIDKHGKDGMALIELADGVTLDEVKSKTEAEFRVALKNALADGVGWAKAPLRRAHHSCPRSCRGGHGAKSAPLSTRIEIVIASQRGARSRDPLAPRNDEMQFHDASFSTAAATSSPFSSSKLRCRGSMPSAQTVTICTTNSPIINDITPATPRASNSITTRNGVTMVAPRPSVLTMPDARNRTSVGNSSGI